MEKAVLNISSLKITQGMNDLFSHKNCLAIDIAGHGNFKAPFTGTVKKIYTKDANQVWLESNDKVKYADGTEDYMTLSIWHDNDVSNLYVGKVIKQGEIFYQEGTKGYVTGAHNHLTVGKGKFTGSGWYGNEQGQAWCINNQYDITKALFLHNDVKVINDYGYNWVKTNNFVYNTRPVEDKFVGISIGDKVTINGVYTSSSSDKKLTPARNTGTITYILSGAKNPYLLDEGNLGWVNDACIVSTPTPTPSNKQYLNLFPSVDSWKVYKTHNYFNPNNESDILAILNPVKFGGLSYEILKDFGDYHFKIKTQQFGIGYIAGNPNKYPCSITNKAEY